MMRAGLIAVSILAFGAVGCMSDGGAAPPAGAQASSLQSVASVAAPRTIEDKFAENGDVKLHYVASGKGPLVVAIHGFPDFNATWDQLRPVLDDRYRFVALDTRGYNLSSQPVGVENYEMPKLVADIEAVIRAEGYDTATVIGHDWGGSIAWMFAFTHPEMLDNLVILSTPHPQMFMREMQTNAAQQASSQYARNFQKEGSEDGMSAEALAGRLQDPAVRAKYLEAFKRSSFAGMMNYYRANYPREVGPGAKRPFVPEDPAPINVPLLIIHGMKDTALLSAGHAGTWEKAAMDSTIVMIPDAGHFVQRDAAELVNATISSWLDIRTK